MSFGTGVVIGIVLALLSIALLMGVGMVAYRYLMDAGLGHDWISELAQWFRSVKARIGLRRCSKCHASTSWLLCQMCQHEQHHRRIE